MQGRLVVILIAVLQNIRSNNAKDADTIDWIKKPLIDLSGVKVDLSTTKLLLKTAGGGNQLRINFEDSRRSDAGGFVLELSSPPKYGFSGCTSMSGATKQLKSGIPKPDKTGYRVFKIEAYGSKGQGLKISCNGTALLTFEPSKGVCTGWSFWDSTWARQKRKVTFTFDNAISYYATVPYADCKGLNSTLKGVTTEPALPVKHEVEISLKCPAGSINRGGNRGVCEDGLIVASGSAPVCLGIFTDTPRYVTEDVETIDWIKKPFIDLSGVKVDFSTTKLLLKTKAGDGNQLRINFEDSRGSDAGGFVLEFSSSPKYGFNGCTSMSGATKQLKSGIPKPDKTGYRVFKIEAYGSKGQGLKISCNGTALLTFEPSKGVCTGWSFWDSTWARQKTKVTFTFDNAISYYATVPCGDKRKQYTTTEQ